MNVLYEILSEKAAMPAEWITDATRIEDLEIESLDFIVIWRMHSSGY